MGEELPFANFLSVLFTLIASGKYWRCIRWCNEGTTILITSPKLFEREVLQGVMKEMNFKDFTSFADLLLGNGFQRVLNSRSSKVHKFCHPRFQKNGNGLGGLGENSSKTDQNGRQRKRKRPVEDTDCRYSNVDNNTASNDNNSELMKPQIKRQRKTYTAVVEDTFVETSVKRTKVNTNKAAFIRGKRIKNFPNTGTSFASTNQNSPKHAQPMSRGVYSPLEITAAHTMLALSTPVVFLQNISLMEVIAAQSIVNLSRSPVFFRERSVSELEAAQALLDLAYSR